MIILGSPFMVAASTRMIDVIGSLGLTSGLKLCLDAGDENSYSSGQKWLDTSGGGYDFFRGTSSSSEATDPTFNGTPGGKSQSEYWSFDGGDFFTYDSANETWMQNIHKNNAIFSIVGWIYLASTGAQQVIFGNTLYLNRVGFGAYANSTGLLSFGVENGSGTIPAYVQNSSAIPTGQWSFVAISFNEATGSNGALFQMNDTQQLFSSTYTSPSSLSATNVVNIGRDPDSSTPDYYIRNGGRVANLSVWEGVALSDTQLSSIYDATKATFGL